MAITMTSAKYGPSISFLAPHHKRSGEMPWLVMVKKQKLSNNNVFSEFKNIRQGGIYPPQQSFVWHVSCTFLVPSSSRLNQISKYTLGRGFNCSYIFVVDFSTGQTA